MSLFSKVKGWFVEPPPVPRNNPFPPQEIPDQPAVHVVYVETPQARYEGSYQYFGERSLIPATLQDSIFDATPGVRCELARRSRYWERNSAVMQRLSDLFEQFTVGPNGLRVIPNAGDDEAVDDKTRKDLEPVLQAALDNHEMSPVKARALSALRAARDPALFNAAASKWWSDWCAQPEIDSLRSFGETQSLIARTWFIDGEVFILKTADQRGRPKLQLIEGHRVGTPTDQQTGEGTTIIDGVELGPDRSVKAYWVRKTNTSALSVLGNTLYPYISPTPEEYERVDASDMIHVFEAVRPGLTRGLPFTYAVMNDLHDFEDLQIEEMRAVKSAADLANIYHTKTGEAENSSSYRRVQRDIQTQDAQGNPVTKTSSISYDVTQSGRDKYLKPGEDVKQFATERPSPATQWFYDYLLSKICAGVGISKLLVMPYSNQGTVVRSDLDVNARFFLARSAVMQRVVLEIYVWAVGWAKDWDRTLLGAPADWNKAIVRPPRSVTVDLGRNSSSMLAELEAGLRTRADIYAEQGEDWREKIRQLAVEAAYINKTATQYGVPRDQIAMPPKPAPAPLAPPAKPEPSSFVPLIHVNGKNGRNDRNRVLNYAQETES